MADTETCVDCAPSERPLEEEPTAVQPENLTNLLDPATFIPPSPLPLPSITIEFCDRVRIADY